MNNTQPIYDQQTNNQDNDPESFHPTRTFNGPIHGYMQHVTREGPVIAYSGVTHVDSGQNKPGLFSGTTAVPDQTAPSADSSATRLSSEKAPEDGQGGDAVLGYSALEAEFRQVSPEMQRYIQYLLQSQKNRQASEGDQH